MFKVTIHNEYKTVVGYHTAQAASDARARFWLLSQMSYDELLELLVATYPGVSFAHNPNEVLWLS